MPFLVILGMLLIAIGAVNLLSAVLQICRCSQTVVGRVAYVDTKPDIGGNGHGFRDCYFPVYEYEVNGKVYQSPGAEYSNRPDYFKLDVQKQIRYNPSDPNECIIDRKSNRFITGVIFMLFGAALVFFG